MLVLTRKVSEKILIGDDIVLTIVKLDGNKVRVGIEAPNHMQVLREELVHEDMGAVGATRHCDLASY